MSPLSFFIFLFFFSPLFFFTLSFSSPFFFLSLFPCALSSNKTTTTGAQQQHNQTQNNPEGNNRNKGNRLEEPRDDDDDGRAAAEPLCADAHGVCAAADAARRAGPRVPPAAERRRAVRPPRLARRAHRRRARRERARAPRADGPHPACTSSSSSSHAPTTHRHGRGTPPPRGPAPRRRRAPAQRALGRCAPVAGAPAHVSAPGAQRCTRAGTAPPTAFVLSASVTVPPLLPFPSFHTRTNTERKNNKSKRNRFL